MESKQEDEEIKIIRKENTFVIGSRGSKLALVQSEFVKESLQKLAPELDIIICVIKTKGDKILDVPLAKIGDKGLFTKELEIALLQKTIDIAVHSLKDIPTKVPEGLCIGSILKRHKVNDCVVMHSKHQNRKIEDLPKGSIIGTSSLRRVAQLKRKFPSFIFKGALGVECRQNDDKILSIVSKMHDKDTAHCCEAERAFLRDLEGGCQVPIGVQTTIIPKSGNQLEDQLELKGIVLSIDGDEVAEGSHTDTISKAKEIGEWLSNYLKKEKNAESILEKVSRSVEKNQ